MRLFAALCSGMAPLNIDYWRGLLFSGRFMTDKVEAKKSLEFCRTELGKYQSLARQGLSIEELMTIDKIIIRFKESIKNIEDALNGS
ncbi:hypothetical protein ACOCIL_19350 [Acinetobacter baumannii]|uniref:hypothetical protein n=1 Tax=Acinetobacter baumannii TaxID=470 RepID=UPI003B427DAA